MVVGEQKGEGFCQNTVLSPGQHHKLRSVQKIDTVPSLIKMQITSRLQYCYKAECITETIYMNDTHKK